MSRSRWHHRLAERRSCAGVVLQQFNAIDGTIKLLNGDVGGAEAGPLHCDVIVACNIVALAAIVSCVRKTHIGFIIFFYFWTLFPKRRLLRRFRRAGCSSGGEWPLPPKGTALGCCAGDAQRGPRCCRSGEWKHTLKTHVRFRFRSTPQVWTAAAALRLGAAARRHHRCCRSLSQAGLQDTTAVYIFPQPQRQVHVCVFLREFVFVSR